MKAMGNKSRRIRKKKQKTSKVSQASRAARVSKAFSVELPKTQTMTGVELAEAAAPKHVEAYESGVLSREEAGTLKGGKLPLGKTHILKKKKGAPPKLTRVRYNLTGP
jgi:hypothetical protein